MKSLAGSIRWSRWISVTAAAALVAILVELVIAPGYGFYQSQVLELVQLREESARLRALEASLPGRRLSLESQRKSFQAAGLAFHGVSENAAGATLESSLVDILKIQQDDQQGRPPSVRVSVSFSASHQALLSALKELPRLKPVVFIDSISIQQDIRASATLSRTAGQTSDAGPYRNDPFLSVELVVRGLIESGSEKK
jgi:Type II secretion system (T2SS), protein M subtype b